MADIPVQHLCSFTHQLATLVSAGVPLLQSLETVAKGLRFKPLQTTVWQLRHDIAQGLSLHSSLRRAEVFDLFYCQLIAAGELSGNLDGMLRRLAAHLQRQQGLRQKVKMAMIYPLAVLIIAALVTAVILIWVVPVFQSIFASFGAELPSPTRWVLRLSEGLIASGPMMLLTLVSLMAGAQWAYRRYPWLQWHAASWQLKWPVVGPLSRTSNTAIWTRCLATLLHSGVPLLDALEVTAGICTNQLYTLFTLSIRHAVSQGRSLSVAMQSVTFLALSAQRPLFDDLLIQMVAVGEDSGALATLLAQAADEREQALERQIEGMTSLIEPLMVVVLGGLVGGLVVALYLPVFQLGQVL